MGEWECAYCGQDNDTLACLHCGAPKHRSTVNHKDKTGEKPRRVCTGGSQLSFCGMGPCDTCRWYSEDTHPGDLLVFPNIHDKSIPVTQYSGVFKCGVGDDVFGRVIGIDKDGAIVRIGG